MLDSSDTETEAVESRWHRSFAVQFREIARGGEARLARARGMSCFNYSDAARRIYAGTEGSKGSRRTAEGRMAGEMHDAYLPHFQDARPPVPTGVSPCIRTSLHDMCVRITP